MYNMFSDIEKFNLFINGTKTTWREVLDVFTKKKHQQKKFHLTYKD